MVKKFDEKEADFLWYTGDAMNQSSGLKESLRVLQKKKGKKERKVWLKISHDWLVKLKADMKQLKKVV